LICSEKQAIDATLKSLADEDPRVGTVADRYWNARGGSYTDGGAFIFNLDEKDPGSNERRLTCIDKFGREVKVPHDRVPYLPGRVYYVMGDDEKERFDISRFFELQRPDLLFDYVKKGIGTWDYADLMDCLRDRRSLHLCPRQCPGSVGTDHKIGEDGGLWRYRADFFIRRKRRGGLRHGQCSRKAPHQCRG